MDSSNVQDIFDDTSQTGNIGTALYVAPELNILGPKAVYNEVSVDLTELCKGNINFLHFLYFNHIV